MSVIWGGGSFMEDRGRDRGRRERPAALEKLAERLGGGEDVTFGETQGNQVADH